MRQAVNLKAASVGGVSVTVATVDGLDPSVAARLANLVAERISGLAVLLVEGRLVLAAAEGSDLHAGNLARELASRCHLKGGGNNRIAQLGGAVPGDLDSYRKTICAILEDERK